MKEKVINQIMGKYTLIVKRKEHLFLYYITLQRLKFQIKIEIILA